MNNEILKANTIKKDNIVLIDGYHRYVNHIDKLVTTGFLTIEKLIEYSNMIRFDNGTIRIMLDRYNSLYN
jgi:hypothetical protein